ncbi:MAG: TonB-dependent hemoglobin/transferrin/lactoferrin family receptor [[Pasteurella] mairii]|nr:TonB-dependent hemoglobin/transferrin/lactoferrin family receptor [[Pasteurella] mairii]
MPNAKHNFFTCSVITAAILGYSGLAFADAEEATALETIHVQGADHADNIQEHKIGEIKKTANLLAKQQVQDSRDLVRYETGVTVVEAGRMGSSGYAIRGVDENRVAIVVDGLQQAETLSSQGFKELFEGYGNFNNTRNSVEIETLKQATIVKGADSIHVGSGGLGGSVVFDTKDARDYLTEKDYHIGYKTGYFSADNQRLHSLTLAGRYKWFDMLLVKTKRNGHELENYDYKNAADIVGKLREKTDPYRIQKDSTLIKFAFNPSENHRFSVVADLYNNRSQGSDLSYSLNVTKTQPDKPNTSTRHTDDSSKRKNYAFNYENYQQNFLWDTLKVTYSQQKIRNRARTDDYCDEKSCEGNLYPYANPLGINYQDGKLVDANGSPLNLTRDANKNLIIVDNENKPLEYPHILPTDTQKSYFNNIRFSEYWLDCGVFNCDKNIEYFNVPASWTGDPITKKSEPLKRKVEYAGKTFAQPENLKSNDFIILPNSKGYFERDYKERDLNTNTKQLNIDLTKWVDLFEIENQFKYGFSYSKTHKEMINKGGFDGVNPTWWAKRFLGMTSSWSNKIATCDNVSGADQWNGLLCPRNNVSSFLIPVINKNKSFYLSDNIKVNHYLSFDVGYRYDRVKYQPDYNASSPRIPDDMVKGLFIPISVPHPGHEPSYASYDYNWEKYHAARTEYNRKKAEYDKAAKNNPQENIDYFSRPKKYQANSYSFASTIDPTEYLRVQVKYAKGFRAPTTDELYFTFKHPDFSILPNVNLKPETAKTQELALTFYGKYGFITAGIFKTKYENFIDLTYLGIKNESNTVGGVSRAQDFILYQNVNRDNAKVTGIDINSKLYLGEFVEALDGFSLSYKYTYQKGRIEGDIPMNAIQPTTSIYGLSYSHQDNKFGVDLYVTHVGKKKAKDTFDMYAKDDPSRPSNDNAIKWRSDSYTLVDLIGYIKPIENLTLQFGVYNLTDRKYITWESARSIRPFGTSNLIDQNTGKGINRFYSPGRHFRFNAELTF